LRRYAEALLPGFVELYQANAQSTRSLTGRGEGGGVLTVDGETANIVVRLRQASLARRESGAKLTCRSLTRFRRAIAGLHSISPKDSRLTPLPLEISVSLLESGLIIETKVKPDSRRDALDLQVWLNSSLNLRR
jgi:hypothetical protein